DEPHNESARRQGTPRERAARTSSKAAQRVNTDSADTIITREYVSQVPSAERGVNAAPASAGALRQIEGQRLQLDRQVHVLQADVLARLDAARSEVENGLDPGRHTLIGDRLRGLPRHRHDGDL